MATPLKLQMEKLFHPTLYNGCNYLSILGLKSIRVSKKDPITNIIYTMGYEENTRNNTNHNKPNTTSMSGGIFDKTYFLSAYHLCLN